MKLAERRMPGTESVTQATSGFAGSSTTNEAVLGDRDLATFPATPEDHHSYAGGLLEHTVGVATLARETAQLHPRLRSDLLLSAALVHDVGRTLELGPGPAFSLTDEGRLLGHVLVVLVAALAQHVEEQDAALPCIHGVVDGSDPGCHARGDRRLVLGIGHDPASFSR